MPYFFIFNAFSVAILNICKEKINLNQERNLKVSRKNSGHFGVIHQLQRYDLANTQKFA